MSQISKITLPNGSQYDLKVYSNHIAPAQSKTFTGVIGTSNNWSDAMNSYASFNQIQSTSYRPAYHNILYRAKAAGITGGTAAISNGVLTITNGSYNTGDSVTVGSTIKIVSDITAS